MRGLTILEPYAALIRLGRKKVENRKWATSYRGPLLIHAGKGPRLLQFMDDGRDMEYDLTRADMRLGMAVAVAELAACYTRADIMDNKVADNHLWLATHEHVEGPFCWVLENVREIKPIPFLGLLGLWNVPAELEAQIVQS